MQCSRIRQVCRYEYLGLWQVEEKGAAVTGDEEDENDGGRKGGESLSYIDRQGERGGGRELSHHISL